MNEQMNRTVVTYIGIAADEAARVERWGGREGVRLPLVEIGWTEKECRRIAEDLGMLAPTYKTGERDGCWFCHNQRVDRLRKLRAEHPDLWEKLLQWDADSTVRFLPKHTVHDFEKRFSLEDEKLVDVKGFKWTDMESPCRQMNIFDYLKEE